MKTAQEMLNEYKVIHEGYHQGAVITFSDEVIIQLMEDYAEQFKLLNNGNIII